MKKNVSSRRVKFFFHLERLIEELDSTHAHMTRKQEVWLLVGFVF